MKNALRVLLLAAIVLFVGAAAVDFDYGSIVINGNTLPYRILFPENYNTTVEYPLFVFLHGAGERGNDNELPLAVWGRDWLIDNFHSKYPAIVLVPQCPMDSAWTNWESLSFPGSTNAVNFSATDIPSTVMEVLEPMIRYWINSGRVNANRVYLTGFSMGGWGTYELLWRMPDTFASSVPIAGGGNETLVGDATANAPLWIFHGDVDPTVNVQHARDMYAYLSAVGRDVRYTEYPGVGHESWVPAWKDPALAPWIYSHTRTA